MIRAFPLDEVLSVTTGRLVAARGIQAIYDILEFFCQQPLFTHQLPKACRNCRPWIFREHPELDSSRADWKSALRALDYRLERAHDNERTGIVADWVIMVRTSLNLREIYELRPIPPGENGPTDPIADLRDLVGPDKMVVVTHLPTGKESEGGMD